MKRQTIVLGALTAWPFVFGVLGLLVEIFGLIPKGSATPPPAFVVFLALLVLTPLAVLGLLVFYLVYLFTKTPLPQERKLIWAVALVAGHVFVMPVFWWRHVWKPRNMAPLPEAKRFAWLVFGPLLLAVLLPLGYLVPMAIGITGAAMLGSGPGSVPAMVVLQSWAWVFGLGLTFVVIAVAGRWCHAVYERLRSRGAVWSLDVVRLHAHALSRGVVRNHLSQELGAIGRAALHVARTDARGDDRAVVGAAGRGSLVVSGGPVVAIFVSHGTLFCETILAGANFLTDPAIFI